MARDRREIKSIAHARWRRLDAYRNSIHAASLSARDARAIRSGGPPVTSPTCPFPHTYDMHINIVYKSPMEREILCVRLSAYIKRCNCDAHEFLSAWIDSARNLGLVTCLPIAFQRRWNTRITATQRHRTLTLMRRVCEYGFFWFKSLNTKTSLFCISCARFRGVKIFVVEGNKSFVIGR